MTAPAKHTPPAGWVAPHARIVTRAGGRRIMDRIGESHNACGAEVTTHDVLPVDFRSCVRAGWPVCEACRAAMGEAA